MDTARLFQSGRSQAVRWPKGYRLAGTKAPGLLLTNWVTAA